MKTLLSWSSGKDSAWALNLLRQNTDIELAGLFTTVNEAFDRVAMHGVRMTVLEGQARAAQLPLSKIYIPSPCPNESYEEAMTGFISTALEDGVEAIAFGDLFLEDIRAYREAMLDGTGIKPLFPVWGLDTDVLARKMVAAGLKAYITTVDPKQLDGRFAGRAFDNALLEDLPGGVDPCGERGEFHTCVVAGPMFNHGIDVSAGEVLERDGFVFADFVLREG